MSTEKKRWLGKALLLALACLAFIWAGKDSTALADDPEGEAIAKLIYASETDEEGNPTGNTSYRFMEDVPDESWSPYAVFVRPATGPAITLEDGRFEGVDYTAVRIWNNDCHVLVEADWVDREKLVLAGDGSYLDVGWSHFQHGQCEADAYNGADDAEDIAAYFNSFVYGDEYYNDESVFMGFDENLKEINPDDPHFNKAVYTIDWDMAVAGLTLEDNVVAFIQDDGAIHISGSIRLGNGAMIEAVDDTPRLFIDTDDASAIDLDLYDYLGAGGETPLTSNVASVYYYTEKEIGGTPTLIWTRVPEDFGREDVKQAAKKYIYAYARLDYDQDNDSDEDDLKLALAAELAWKFRVYGPFGLYDNYDGATEEIWGNLLHDAEILARRIELEGTSPINAIDSEGQNEEIARYVATINWGHTITGTEIQSTVYLYQLYLPEELLICTDFNESTGTGNSFYVRKDFEDKRILIGDVNNPPASVDEDFFSTVLVVNSFSNVAAGGNGVAMEVKNRDNNLLTFQTIAYYLMKHKEGGSIHNLNTATTVKIFKSGGRFFAAASEGEAKRHDYITHETGGVADKIWEAGGRYPVKVFIHDTTLHIMPLNSNAGRAGTALREVRLADASLSRAVEINNNDQEDIVITFNSNFYDTVTFKLVYDDGIEKTFTVEREGLSIFYQGLGNNDEAGGTRDQGRRWIDIYGEGNGNDLFYTYDCDTENIVVMATYTHSSAETGVRGLKLIITYDDDGTTEIIDSNDASHDFEGFRSGNSSLYLVDGRYAADTTTFIIGFMKSDEPTVRFSKNGHVGGFSIQIVKAGFDDPDSFGGALAGSGKGKHWDGIANIWY